MGIEPARQKRINKRYNKLYAIQNRVGDVWGIMYKIGMFIFFIAIVGFIHQSNYTTFV
jgi:hypothetical protein